MFFWVSKILWGIASPGNLLLAVLALAWGLLGSARWRRVGRTLLAGAVLALLAVTVLPVADWLTIPLERRFPARPPPERVDGILVLGGAIDGVLSAARGGPALNEAAERMVAAAELARRYPSARLVFSGGSGVATRPDAVEAPFARMAFVSLGLPPDRALYEDRSRNTWENATLSRALLAPQPGETWLLVTSAWHMPRAVGSLRAAGWPEPLAVPVDFRTAGEAVAPFDALVGLARTALALREWIGLLAYRLDGRTDALFPAPLEPPVAPSRFCGHVKVLLACLNTSGAKPPAERTERTPR